MLHLVDDYVMAVDLELGELLHQPLRLVEGQKLRDADAHEGGQLWIPELCVDLLHNSLRGTLSYVGAGNTRDVRQTSSGA